VKEKYAGEYWHVLPREMARFWKALAAPSPARPKEQVS
jgi:hypothetical protein